MNKSPNVVFILIDSARFDHFSIYGYNKRTTPYLDDMASDLLVYDNANAPAAWTRPAMASIFTSLYPEQYGFFDDMYPGEETTVLPEILKGQSYRTVVISDNPYMSPATGFDRGVDHFLYVRREGLLKVLDNVVVLRNALPVIRQLLDRRTAYKVIPQMMNDQAIRIIRDARRWKAPFMIYIHHDAHHPYLSDRRYLSKFLAGSYREQEIKEVETIQRTGGMLRFNKETIPASTRQRYYDILRGMHDASICKNDLMIRALADALKSCGLYENTMIIITADHGEFLGEKDLISHGLYPYEESVRVPLMIKYPRDLSVTGRTGRLVSTIDIMPTIVGILNREVREFTAAAQGISLLSDLKHDFIVSQRKNFSEGLDFWRRRYPDHDFDRYDYGNIITLKSLDSKFVWSSKGKHALFDLKSDPTESENRYSPGDEKSGKHLALCRRWMEGVPKVRGEDRAQFDEQMRKHLRGLGYIA